MKVVINSDYGGFGLSEEAYKELGLEWDGYGYEYTRGDRSDPKLVAVVEKLGERANGESASLKIVKIPDDIDYEIEDYNGIEIIEEVHRRWY